MHELATGGSADGGSTFVREINNLDEGDWIVTVDELKELVKQLIAGKILVVLSRNQWGSANEYRLSYVTRVRGFEIVDGEVVIKDQLSLLFDKSEGGDIDHLEYFKREDGNYDCFPYFNK